MQTAVGCSRCGPVPGRLPGFQAAFWELQESRAQVVAAKQQFKHCQREERRVLLSGHSTQKTSVLRMLLSSSMLGSALAAQGLTVFSGPTEALAMQQHLSWASHTAQPKPFQYSLQVPPPNSSRCDQQQRHLWWRPAPSAATGGCPEGGRAGRVQAGPYSHRICAGRQVSLLGLPRPACIRTMATSQHHGVQ